MRAQEAFARAREAHAGGTVVGSASRGRRSDSVSVADTNREADAGAPRRTRSNSLRVPERLTRSGSWSGTNAPRSPFYQASSKS